jgi:bacterioferritin-associated ferredoxin
MYVCVCHAITDRQICNAVEQGASSLCEVQMLLPVGGCCGSCVATAEALIVEHQRHSQACGCRAAPEAVLA